MAITRDQIIKDVFEKDGISLTKDDPVINFIAIHEYMLDHKVKQLNEDHDKFAKDILDFYTKSLDDSIQKSTQEYGDQIREYTEQYAASFFNEADEYLEKKFNGISSKLIDCLDMKIDEIKSLRSQFAYFMWITVGLTLVNLVVVAALIYRFF